MLNFLFRIERRMKNQKVIYWKSCLKILKLIKKEKSPNFTTYIYKKENKV
jgi:hypothetical protein